MNEIQIELISRLLARNGLPFRFLAKGYTYEDNVVYHIKQLIKTNYITKRDNKYFLTSEGLIKSTEIDFNTIEIKKFKELYVSFVCFYKNMYLITSKNFNNEIFYKLPGHKPFFGETSNEYLNRLISHEIGQSIEIHRVKYLCEHSRIIKTTNKKVLFDNIMYVYVLELSENEFVNSKLKKGNTWIPKDDLLNLKNKWPEIDMCILKNGTDKYYEYEFISNYIIDVVDL